VTEGGRAVLIDPGPVSDFEDAFRAFSAICDVTSLEGIAVTQPDPDACASLPLWEKAGFEGKIIANWKTALLLPTLGIRSGFRFVYQDEPGETGRFLGLRFMPFPHLGSPGALCLFDPKTKTLFSGNLFGCFGRNAPLLGESESTDRVVQFHERNAPSGELLRSALDGLEPLGATLICPQHGSAREVDIPGLFDALRRGSYGELTQERMDAEAAQQTELERLREEHLRLQESVILGQDDIMRDRLTGLYNRTYLDEFLPAFVAGAPEGAMATVRLDGMKTLERESGEEAVNEAIRVFSRMAVEGRGENTLAFRDSGPAIRLLFQDEESAIPEILRLQKEVAGSDAFEGRMTCGGAVAFCVESSDPGVLTENLRDRSRALDAMGPGSLCVSTEGNLPLREGSVLLVEPDRALARLFADYLGSLRFEVRVAEGGEEALAAIARDPPVLTICEEKVPRSDVFAIHEAFARGTGGDGKGFIVLTERKNGRLIRRCFEAGIRYLLEKPVMLAELEYLAKSLWEDALALR